MLEAIDHLTTSLNNIVVMVAAGLGGWWALRRLRIERTDEAALTMEFSAESVPHESVPHGGEHLVMVNIKLENKGRTQITAKTKRDKQGFIFNDGPEQLQNACSLQLKRFQPPGAARVGYQLEWFENHAMEPVSSELTAGTNLLTAYEDPGVIDAHHRPKVDFWLEPGESYDLGAPLVLPAGTYLAKVTFVAAGGDDNFWSRFFLLSVPPVGAPQTTAGGTP